MSSPTFTTAYHQPGISRKMRTRVKTLAAFIQVMKLVVVHSVEKCEIYSPLKNILWTHLLIMDLIKYEMRWFFGILTYEILKIFTLCTSCHQFIYEGKWLFFGLHEVVPCTLFRDISGTTFRYNICTNHWNWWNWNKLS